MGVMRYPWDHCFLMDSSSKFVQPPVQLHWDVAGDAWSKRDARCIGLACSHLGCT